MVTYEYIQEDVDVVDERDSDKESVKEQEPDVVDESEELELVDIDISDKQCEQEDLHMGRVSVWEGSVEERG